MIKYRSVKIILIIISIILVYILSAVLPYVKQPDITAHTIQNTDINNFYGDASVCDERVKIIADNGEALSERIRLIAHAKKKSFSLHLILIQITAVKCCSRLYLMLQTAM